MRAFVIGNGVSLKQMQLDKLIGETTFAMNRIDLLYEPALDYGIAGTSWRPTHYLFMEWLAVDNPHVPRERTDEIEEPMFVLPKGARQPVSVFGNPFRDFVIPYHIAPGVEHCLLRASHKAIYDAAKASDKRWLYKQYRPTWVQLNCEHAGMYSLSDGRPLEWHLPVWCKYGGTMNVALQFAFAMGHEPVYVIGCDLDYQPIYRTSVADPNHFHPDYWTWEDNPLENRDDTLNEMHAIARRAFERAGRHIFNAGIGGKLTAYERVDFDSLFE